MMVALDVMVLRDETRRDEEDGDVGVDAVIDVNAKGGGSCVGQDYCWCVYVPYTHAHGEKRVDQMRECRIFDWLYKIRSPTRDMTIAQN